MVTASRVVAPDWLGNADPEMLLVLAVGARQAEISPEFRAEVLAYVAAELEQAARRLADVTPRRPRGQRRPNDLVELARIK